MCVGGGVGVGGGLAVSMAGVCVCVSECVGGVGAGSQPTPATMRCDTWPVCASAARPPARDAQGPGAVPAPASLGTAVRAQLARAGSRPRAAGGGRPARTLGFRYTWPRVGCSSPEMRPSSVDLPAAARAWGAWERPARSGATHGSGIRASSSCPRAVHERRCRAARATHQCRWGPRLQTGWSGPGCGRGEGRGSGVWEAGRARRG